MDVFTLEGEALKDRGNFFASMYIVLASGCLVVYMIMGWSVNAVAQVGFGILKPSIGHRLMIPSTRPSNTNCAE